MSQDGYGRAPCDANSHPTTAACNGVVCSSTPRRGERRHHRVVRRALPERGAEELSPGCFWRVARCRTASMGLVQGRAEIRSTNFGPDKWALYIPCFWHRDRPRGRFSRSRHDPPYRVGTLTVDSTTKLGDTATSSKSEPWAPLFTGQNSGQSNFGLAMDNTHHRRPELPHGGTRKLQNLGGSRANPPLGVALASNDALQPHAAPTGPFSTRPSDRGPSSRRHSTPACRSAPSPPVATQWPHRAASSLPPSPRALPPRRAPHLERLV